MKEDSLPIVLFYNFILFFHLQLQLNLKLSNTLYLTHDTSWNCKKHLPIQGRSKNYGIIKHGVNNTIYFLKRGQKSLLKMDTFQEALQEPWHQILEDTYPLVSGPFSQSLQCTPISDDWCVLSMHSNIICICYLNYGAFVVLTVLMLLTWAWAGRASRSCVWALTLTNWRM